MNVEVNTANVLKTVGTVVMLGGLLWGLATKFNDAELRDKELHNYAKIIETKLDMLLEERMAKMERTELYNRMNEVLKITPSDSTNYSVDKYMPKDYEQAPASKK